MWIEWGHVAGWIRTQILEYSRLTGEIITNAEIIIQFSPQLGFHSNLHGP
jgi:hypothetical protein